MFTGSITFLSVMFYTIKAILEFSKHILSTIIIHISHHLEKEIMLLTGY